MNIIGAKFTDDKKSLLAILLCSIIWGAIPFISLELSKELTAIQITTLRYLLGGIFLVGIASYSEIRKSLSSDLKNFILISLVGITIPQIVFISSIKLIPVTLASFIEGAYPIAAIAIGVLFMGEKPTKKQLIGLGISIAGLFLLTRPDLAHDSANWMGILLAFIAMICWGISTAIGKNLTRSHPPKVIAVLRYSMAGIFAMALMFFEPSLPKLAAASAISWFWVAVVAISSALTLVLYYQSLKNVSLTATSIIESTQPAWTLLISVLLFSQGLPAVSLFGAALVLGGTAFASIPSGKKESPAIEPAL